MFWEHIEAAKIANVPLIIHTRNAEDETFQILKEAIKRRPQDIDSLCIGSKEFAFKLIDIGSYISASGVITFKKFQDLANTFKQFYFKYYG